MPRRRAPSAHAELAQACVPAAVQAVAEQFADLLIPAVGARRQAGPLSIEEPRQGVVNRDFRVAKVRFSIGHDLTEPIRSACLAVPKRRWGPAITADGSRERDGADVAEITDLVDLSRWPSGTRPSNPAEIRRAGNLVIK